MKKIIMILSLYAFLLTACASGGKAKVSGLVTLDEALARAATDVSSRVSGIKPGGKPIIAVAGLVVPLSEVSEFITDGLLIHFVNGGKFDVVERNKAYLAVLNAEHQFQMSGMVSDASAVGIGHYLGAQIIITGSFLRTEGFSQLRLRALDVETAKILSMYETRIHPNDTVLASVMRLLDGINAYAVSEKALAHLNRGIDFFREGKDDKAIREFDKALDINKDFAEAYFFRGTVYGFKKNWDKAIADLSEALRIQPNHTDALNNRGAFYAIMGDNEKAINEINTALKFKPDNASGLNTRGAVYLKMGDIDHAVEDLTAALHIEPNYSTALSNRGLAYMFMFAHNTTKALDDFNAALEIQPDYVDALNGRGAFYAFMGDAEKAATDFMTALEIQTNNANALNNLAALLGRSTLNRDTIDRAIVCYTAALKVKPVDYGILIDRGYAYGKKGNHDRALADILSYAKKKGSHDDVLSFAYNYLEGDFGTDYNHALKIINAAIKTSPRIAEGYKDRGYVYGKMNNWDKAIADYSTALRIQPDDIDTVHKRGSMYLEKGDIDRAAAEFKKVLLHHAGTDLEHLFANMEELSDLLYERENLYHFFHVIPNDMNERGKKFLESGDIDSAIKVWEAALRLNPYHYDVRQNLEQARQRRR